MNFLIFFSHVNMPVFRYHKGLCVLLLLQHQLSENCLPQVNVIQESNIVYKHMLSSKQIKAKGLRFEFRKNYLSNVNPLRTGDPKQVSGKQCRPRSDAAEYLYHIA